MAGRDDEAPPLTFPELFVIYCNFDLKKGVVAEEADLKFEKILLSQSDFWMQKADLIGKGLTLTETGVAFNKFNKWRLDYEEYREYLQNICEEKQLDFTEVIEMLQSAGAPTAADMMKIS